MDSTPENSEQIRCGMCGTLNPADAATCEHCGARLRPMTPEELGIIPSGDELRAAQLPPQAPAEDDPMAVLRSMSMESYDDETIIGPSAQRQILPSEESAQDEEPDFTFGGKSWLDDQNLEPTEDARSIIPDWLGGMDSQDAPTSRPADSPGSEEDSSEAAMPDWLREAYGSPAEKTTEETSLPPFGTSINDELDALRPPDDLPIVQLDQEPPQEEVESAAPLVDSGLPDWLQAMEDSTPAEEEPAETPASPAEIRELLAFLDETGESQDAESDEMPAWLSGLGLGGESHSEAPSQEIEESPPEPESSSDSDVPDWLAEETPTETVSGEKSQQEPAAESVDEGNIPDWLTGLATEEPAASEEPSTTDEATQATPITEPSAEVEVPEWLAGLGGEETSDSDEPVQETLSMEPDADVEVPEWLAGLGGEETFDSDEPVQETPSIEPGADVEVPEWLAGLGSEETSDSDEPVQEIPSIEPGADVEVPEWLAGFGGEEPATSDESAQETPLVEPGEEVEVPEWLAGLGGEEAAVSDETAASEEESLMPEIALSAEESSPEIPVFDAVPAGDIEDEAPDWLSALDDNFALPSEGSPASAIGEDLLGLSGDLAMPVAPQAEEEIDLAAENLPTWLRDSTEGGSAEAYPATERLPEGMLSEMASLRFEAITSRKDSAATTETVGALKDVTGVVKAELLFNGTSLQAGQIVDHVLVSPEQQKRIQTLEALFGQESKGVAISGRSSAFPLVRWITALILIAAIAAAALAGISLLSTPAAGEGPQAVHQLIDGVAASRAVVMVFEYEGDTSAELQPLATALMEHLAGQSAAVYTISSRPTGPAMAEMALSEVHEQTRTPGWVDLGYLAGGTKGISALTAGTLPGVVSPLSFDYQNQPTGLTSTRLDDLDPALVIVVAAQAEDLRAWVEQISPSAGYPIVAAMSVSSTPMTIPYVQSGQVAALVSGINDAVSYRALENQTPSPLLAAKWNAQALGGAAAAAMILAGAVFNILRAIQQSQE